MAAYYNEIEPFAADWLRELIKMGLIADGVVDGRDIRDVEPNEIREFTQCHFFAGIGVWSYALRLAKWNDERRVWTGSCPCQPFSTAGKRKGTTDERHLWPSWHWLIRECKPDVIFGEQVASSHGIAWLDIVSNDLEAEGYAVGPGVFPACGVGAPHLRKRLWLVAESNSHGRQRSAKRSEASGLGKPGEFGARDILADSESGGCGELGCQVESANYGHDDGRCDSPRELADTHGGDAGAKWQQSVGQQRQFADNDGTLDLGFGVGRPGPINGHWGKADWLYCRDGKWRPVESGSFPLVNGTPHRLGRLRGYGNAIVAQAASEIISAYMEFDQ